MGQVTFSRICEMLFGGKYACVYANGLSLDDQVGRSNPPFSSLDRRDQTRAR